MARIHDVIDFVQKGRSPNEMATTLRCDVASIYSNLYKAAGKGLLSPIGIYLCIRADYSNDGDDVRYVQFTRLAIAEHYLQIRDIERTLHEAIKNTLIDLFGDDEDGWWRQGIPKDIRMSCASMRENDPTGANYEPFTYTNFMDLKKIIQTNRNKHQVEFPFLNGLSKAEYDDFLKDIEKLNSVRNTVMHPVRVQFPSDDQLRFVEDLHKKIIPQ